VSFGDYLNSHTLNPEKLYNQTMKRTLSLLLLLFLLAGCGRGSTLSATPTAPLLPPTHTLPAPSATQTLPALAIPTATPPSGVPSCRPQDLTASSQTDAATGSITFSLKLTNTSAAACRLPSPPRVELFQPGKTDALVVNPYYSCFLCDRNATPGVPTLSPTQQAEDFNRILAETVDIPAGGSVQIFLIWSNWCADPVTGIDLRFSLGGEGLVTSTDAYVSPPCLAEAAPASLMISQYIH
jgi:hypothetical protein